MTDVNQWSSTDGSNNGASPTGWASGSMLPSGVEPSARAMMGGTKRLRDQIGPTATSGGTANVQTLTYSPAHGAYAAGDVFAFVVGGGLTNSGSATVNVNGLGAKTVKLNGSNLVGGELIAGGVAVVMYDGTNLNLLNPALATGTWTPALAFGGASVGITYSSQAGIYRRYGSLVVAEFDITLTAKGSSTGAATITGVPYTPTRMFPCPIAFFTAMSGVGAGFSGTLIDAATTSVQLNGPSATGANAYTDTAFTNTTRIAGSCVFATA